MCFLKSLIGYSNKGKLWIIIYLQHVYVAFHLQNNNKKYYLFHPTIAAHK